MGHYVHRLNGLCLYPIKRRQPPNEVGNEREPYSPKRFGVITQLIYFPAAARLWARYLITQAFEVQAVVRINYKRQRPC